MLGPCPNDHHVARTADPLFGAEAEHLAVEHPNDPLGVTVRLDMDAAPLAVSSLQAAALYAAVSQARAEFRGCNSRTKAIAEVFNHYDLQPPR